MVVCFFFFSRENIWKNPFSPVMPEAFSKAIIYIMIIKHLYSAINKHKTPVNVGKVPSLPQALVGQHWLYWWPMVAEAGAGRMGRAVVLPSQEGAKTCGAEGRED